MKEPPISLTKKELTKSSELKYHESPIGELSDTLMAAQLYHLDIERLAKIKVHHLVQASWEKNDKNPLHHFRGDAKLVTFIHVKF